MTSFQFILLKRVCPNFNIKPKSNEKLENLIWLHFILIEINKVSLYLFQQHAKIKWKTKKLILLHIVWNKKKSVCTYFNIKPKSYEKLKNLTYHGWKNVENAYICIFYA